MLHAPHWGAVGSIVTWSDMKWCSDVSCFSLRSSVFHCNMVWYEMMFRCCMLLTEEQWVGSMVTWSDMKWYSDVSCSSLRSMEHLNIMSHQIIMTRGNRGLSLNLWNHKYLMSCPQSWAMGHPLCFLYNYMGLHNTTISSQFGIPIFSMDTPCILQTVYELVIQILWIYNFI